MTTARYGKRAVELPAMVEDPKTGRYKVRGGVNCHTHDGASGSVNRPEPTDRSKLGTMEIRRAQALARPVANLAPAPIYKSKLEAAYVRYLEALKFGEVIQDWWYEPWNFRLPGKRNYHRLDFLVWFPDGHMEIHQTKGWHKNLREGVSKAKTVAGLHPWAIHRLVTWDKGQWQYKQMEA